MRNWLCKQAVSRAAFQPTGRCRRNLRQCFRDAGIETVLVDSLRGRRFAEVLGQFAKNDRINAAMLARLDHLDGVGATPLQTRNLALLRDLRTLCRKLFEQLGTRISSASNSLLRPPSAPGPYLRPCTPTSPLLSSACSLGSLPTPNLPAAQG